jgi:hypothetical protein
MTPDEADALATIVTAVDEAGGRIRGTDVDHEAKGGVESAMQQMLGGGPQIRPIFTLKIVADPAVVLDEADEDEQAPSAIERARTRIKNLDGEGIDQFTKRQALQVLEETPEEDDGQVEIDLEGAAADGGE